MTSIKATLLLRTVSIVLFVAFLAGFSAIWVTVTDYRQQAESRLDTYGAQIQKQLDLILREVDRTLKAESRDAAMLPRIRLFAAGVSEVMAWYGALPSNLRNGVFNGPDGRQGFTCSIWSSDEAMREAAYHAGTHRARMGESKAGLMFDYSSFTRLRALGSHGDWDGDPFVATSSTPIQETAS